MSLRLRLRLLRYALFKWPLYGISDSMTYELHANAAYGSSIEIKTPKAGPRSGKCYVFCNNTLLKSSK